ncbi:hypothetical protein [Rhizobium sp. No.120]
MSGRNGRPFAGSSINLSRDEPKRTISPQPSIGTPIPILARAHIYRRFIGMIRLNYRDGNATGTIMTPKTAT